MPFPMLFLAGLAAVVSAAANLQEPVRKDAAVQAPLVTVRGQVVPLAEHLKKQGVELDPDAGAHWLALETADGKAYPLVKDSGGRMFFRDASLLARPMQVKGRILPGTGLFQVFQVQSLKSGQLHDVYYWCEVCAIKRLSLERTGICECCGGPMELREVPAGK